jgi:hypothetical protein
LGALSGILKKNFNLKNFKVLSKLISELINEFENFAQEIVECKWTYEKQNKFIDKLFDYINEVSNDLNSVTNTPSQNEYTNVSSNERTFIDPMINDKVTINTPDGEYLSVDFKQFFQNYVSFLSFSNIILNLFSNIKIVI